jgi:nitrite reductase/ring-hydroxylating ferredoxin subunit
VVALTHFYFVLNRYFVFSPTDAWAALLSSNTAYGQALGFPFEALGIFALLALLVLAATSHDFWLKFLTPPVWKSLHYLIYPAYAAGVGHVMLGAVQDQQGASLAGIVIGGAVLVAGLHVAAALKERACAGPAVAAEWQDICAPGEIADEFARIARLPGGERVAVFRHGSKLSAIANACAHQNGPLGEGRILDCLVTCPWHGFQYDVTTGRSPAPFTETIPTYRLRLRAGRVEVDPATNPPGTFVEPLVVPDGEGRA